MSDSLTLLHDCGAATTVAAWARSRRCQACGAGWEARGTEPARVPAVPPTQFLSRSPLYVERFPAATTPAGGYRNAAWKPSGERLVISRPIDRGVYLFSLMWFVAMTMVAPSFATVTTAAVSALTLGVSVWLLDPPWRVTLTSRITIQRGRSTVLDTCLSRVLGSETVNTSKDASKVVLHLVDPAQSVTLLTSNSLDAAWLRHTIDRRATGWLTMASGTPSRERGTPAP